MGPVVVSEGAHAGDAAPRELPTSAFDYELPPELIAQAPPTERGASRLLVVRHDDEGAFGLVINRPSPMRLDEVLEESLGHLPARTDEIYLGGPVQGPLMALHTLTGVGDLDNLGITLHRFLRCCVVVGCDCVTGFA